MRERRIGGDVEAGEPARLPERPPVSLVVAREEDVGWEVEAVPDLPGDHQREVQRESTPEGQPETTIGERASTRPWNSRAYCSTVDARLFRCADARLCWAIAWQRHGSLSNETSRSARRCELPRGKYSIHRSSSSAIERNSGRSVATTGRP